MTKKLVKEGAKKYALKRALGSVKETLPLVPVQAALGAGVGGLSSMGAGKGAALSLAIHTMLAGKDAVKTYKNSKEHYKLAKKNGLAYDLSGNKFDEGYEMQYEDIIKGTLENNPLQVRQAVHNILGQKVLEKVEAMRNEVALGMTGGEKNNDEDSSIPSTPIQQPENDEEDIYIDDEDFDDSGFEYDDEDLEDNIDLETDK
jgi:hypothetical protein